MYDDLKQFDNFSDRFAEQWYFTLCGLLKCFIDALREVENPDDQRTLVKTFLEFFVSERAYENSATPLHVWGSQVNASWRTRGIELFGNYSYTHPGRSSVLQGGAIARHQGTLGIGGGWRNLSGSMRVNVAGARNLEPLSRGVVAYLEKQGNRVRYADPLSASVSREIDPYAVANGAVTYQFMPGLAVQTTINNIFNAHTLIQEFRTQTTIVSRLRCRSQGDRHSFACLTRF